jgi:hypothetical protein
MLKTFIFLIFYFFTSMLFSQEVKKIEYEQAIEIEGQLKKAPPLEVEVVSPTEPVQENTKSSDVNKELEEQESIVDKSAPVQIQESDLKKEELLAPIVETPVKKKESPEEVGEAPVEKEVVEEKLETAPEKPQVSEQQSPEKFYDFFFDNTRPALFKTKARWKGVKFSLGGFNYFPNTYQAKATGGKDKGDYLLTLGLGLNFGEVGRWSFLPHLHASFPKKTTDGLLKNYFYSFGLDGSYRVFDFLSLRIGSSFLLNTIKGTKKDGEIVVQEGDSEFFTVSGARTSIQNTLDLGMTFKYKEFELDLDYMAVALFEKEKKNSIYGISLSYFFESKIDPIEQIPAVENNQEVEEGGL